MIFTLKCIGVVITLVFVALMLRKYTRLDFVSHWRQLHKAWSVRLMAAAGAFQLVLQHSPQSFIDAWNSLPPDIKSYLPPGWTHYISIAMTGLALFVAPFKQNNMRRPDDRNNSDPSGQ